jgi:anti-sigma factor RsiW
MKPDEKYRYGLIMTTRLSSHDLEILSTYLDGQLTSSERARLESRLQVETELRTTLEEMRRTQAMLRAAPALRAPRNYTLRPDMVKAPRRAPSAYPFLRLATALASLLFILAFAGDLISRGATSPAPVALVQEEAVVRTMAVEEAAVTEQGLMQGKAPPAPAAESAQSLLPAQELTETASAPMLQMEMMAASPESTQLAGDQVPDAADTLRNAPETQLEHPELQTDAEARGEVKASTGLTWLNPWRAIEIIALICAIVCGLGAIYLHRRE